MLTAILEDTAGSSNPLVRNLFGSMATSVVDLFLVTLFVSLRKETQAKREDFSNKGMRTNMEK